MQVDAAAALAYLRISGRPLARLGQIPLKGLLALLIRNIKVDDDVVFRELDVVQLAGVQGGQLCPDTLPFVTGRAFSACILGGAVGAVLVKRRSLPLHKVDGGVRGRHRLVLRRLFLKFFRPKPAVIVPNAGPVPHAEPLLVTPEVVLQLLLKYHAGDGVGHLGVLAVDLIHLPGRLQGHAIVPFEHMIGVHDEVIKVIGGPHHGDGNIIVVVVRVLQIDLLTVIGNAAQLKGDLPGQPPVLVRRNLVPGGRHVDQPSDDTGFRVRNLDRLVGSHDEEGLKAVGVGGAELFVDSHHLVGHQRIDAGVVLDAGEVAVMLNGHQRIGAEGLQSKGVAGGAQVLGAEAGVVSLEELHDHIDDGALSGAHRSVEDQKLLQLLGLPGNDSPDAPLDLVPLLGRI